MPELQERWTRAEVLALPDDGNRHELVDGVLLVTPTPRLPHQWAVKVLYALVDPYVSEHRFGVALCLAADLDLGGDHRVQPDLFVLPRWEGPTPEAWEGIGIPLLTVEVLSPSTARQDRTLKRRLYQRAGVAEYWIVDRDARLVERWRPDDERPEVLNEELLWHPAGAPEALRIDLPAYFREVWG